MLIPGTPIDYEEGWKSFVAAIAALRSLKLRVEEENAASLDQD